MFTHKVFPLNCGTIIVDKGAVLTCGVGTGEKVAVPMFAFLIRSENGNLLFDAGVDPDDQAFLDLMDENIRVRAEDNLLHRLRNLGMRAEDIDYVFLSHLHFDHSGMLRYFKNARVFIQRQEYGYAINPSPAAAAVYRRHYYDSPGINWQMVDGDTALLPGFKAIATPGHTPGHQSLLMKLAPDSAVIFTGDCVYLEENIEKEIIPGIFVDSTMAMASLQKVKNLATATGARVLFSHSA